MRARRAAVLSLAALVGYAVCQDAGLRAQPPDPPRVAAAPAARSALSPRNASYAISVRLDPASRTLKGDELLTWRNVTATATRSLRFHLYYNAWRNNESTWMRERRLAGNTTLALRPQADWGWIDITSLRLIGAGGTPTDLTSSIRYVSPDDGNVDDRTVAEVLLGVAVQPGQTINVQIGWSSRVPRTFARTGAIGDFYFLAQWFPKIGVLEDSGWNCHQFHSSTEFFSDFGVYDVRLTVPKGWIVGATGRERGRRDEGEETTHQYYAEDVHDFAWTTSPDYVERTATFEDPRLPAVSMRLLLQPEHAGQAERHFQATRATLKYYGDWFGPYPYGQITIVDPAWQSGAGGMEYPTLFTGGSRWLAPARVLEPEGVVVHEAGHQFWYGLVATNEFEHAWMDEGFNTFSTARALEQAFAPDVLSQRFFGDFIPWAFTDIPLSRALDGNRLAGYRAAARAETQSTPTWRYWPGTGGVVSYNKTALWLNTLERLIGWDTLQRIMSTYFTRYQFKHPRPEDFFAVASEVSGRDLTWFFDRVYRSPAAFDYGIEQFTSGPDSVRGFVGDGNLRRTADPASSGGSFHTTVVARRYEDGVFPVDVRVGFENGEEVRWRWEGVERWKVFEVDRPVRAAYAQIDPERVLLLDRNYTNNSARLTADAAGRAGRKWSLTWLVWLQDRLLTYGFFV